MVDKQAFQKFVLNMEAMVWVEVACAAGLQ